LADMDSETRRRAKAINFGIIYGISAFGLANNLGISRTEAKEYIDSYFKKFPGIKDYMEATKNEAREFGYVKTLFGRKCHVPSIRDKNPMRRSGAERQAINAPIQGTAADIIRRAMMRMPETISKLEGTRMLLQVHDELIFETPSAQARDLINLVRPVMVRACEPAVTLSVPLVVDANAADNWNDAH
ncbi:MAG TPA: DNA polymerase I, partial [Hellea balneolensis]|nr:DNA polymerase I [Hellea balneolensis]